MRVRILIQLTPQFESKLSDPMTGMQSKGTLLCLLGDTKRDYASAEALGGGVVRPSE
jgi:hypothetical protein